MVAVIRNSSFNRNRFIQYACALPKLTRAGDQIPNLRGKRSNDDDGDQFSIQSACVHFVQIFILVFKYVHTRILM